MADAITNLTATWLAGNGIQLNWTAAADVSTSSVYQVYVLTNTNTMFPVWNLAITLNPNIAQISGSANLTLTAPMNSYFYSFLTLASVPASVAFSIVHVDSSNTSSTPLNISVFAPAINPVYGPPHFTNNLTLDPFGQFAVNPQDSYDEIAASVSMVVGALIGERTMLPEFGIEDPTFTEIDTASIEQEIEKWEPRANVSVSAIYDDYNNASLSVSITSNLGNN
jgi:phage baseplate assembly protein W